MQTTFHLFYHDLILKIEFGTRLQVAHNLNYNAKSIPPLTMQCFYLCEGNKTKPWSLRDMQVLSDQRILFLLDVLFSSFDVFSTVQSHTARVSGGLRFQWWLSSWNFVSGSSPPFLAALLKKVKVMLYRKYTSTAPTYIFCQSPHTFLTQVKQNVKFESKDIQKDEIRDNLKTQSFSGVSLQLWQLSVICIHSAGCSRQQRSSRRLCRNTNALGFFNTSTNLCQTGPAAKPQSRAEATMMDIICVRMHSQVDGGCFWFKRCLLKPIPAHVSKAWTTLEKTSSLLL